MEKKYFHLSSEELVKVYQTDLDKGLSHDVVLEKQQKFGLNRLDEPKKRPLILRFIDQLKDFMIIILIGASILSMFTESVAEGLLIIAIVIVNAILGVAQEAKAEKALDSIKAMSSPHVTVIRDGIEKVIDVKEIVIGDIVKLQAGDYVPADVRIIESINLKIDESALTGEAVPVEKEDVVLEAEDVALGDRINSAYMSTVVTYGRGKAVVIATGMQTEIGKIATMLSEAESVETPLQKNIAQLGKILALIALSITGFIFVIEIVTSLLAGQTPDWIGAILFAVSLAVAAIPEGLPAIITVVLSLGMQNLVKQRAIMRTLPAVETLGSTSIICSDKTGTLTQNVMTVQKVYVDSKIQTVSDLTYSGNSKKLVEYGVLVNDTKVQLEGSNFVKFGDPTELAFVDLAIALKQNPISITENFPRLYELPFDSERKLMSTVHKIDGKLYAIIKGAPDVLFSRAKYIVLDNNILSATTSEVQKFIDANESMSNEALRVLAVAYKEITTDKPLKQLSFEDLESNVTLLGLVGMIDPERPEAKDAIALCYQAGIKTIMITGDHKNTAIAIAKNLNILSDNEDLAITGRELDQMSDEEFKEKLEHIRVYARVSPENKVRIVKAWRETKRVVAMTGDGVNDAPSIKQADIGIAMGITGTEVAKGAADMVLTDDNFATIVNAVGEGRSIFANIKKAIHFLLSCNIGEIVSMFLGVTVGLFIFKVADANGNPVEGTVHILIAVQILWVNLVTDSLMAIALGLESKEPNIMQQMPRDATKSIFADGLGKTIAWQGIMIGLLTFIAYYIGYNYEPTAAITTKIMHAQTMAFMVLALSQLVHAFNARSQVFSVFTMKPNKALIYALFISLALQLAAVSFDFTQRLFEVEFPDFKQWLMIIGLSLVPLIVVEITKIFKRKKLNL